MLSPIAPPGHRIPKLRAFILYPLRSLRFPDAIRSLVGFADWNSCRSPERDRSGGFNPKASF
jgi:hypothetical protein